jgi:DNA-directed RNA polymerase subunit RPC12/RpoP
MQVNFTRYGLYLLRWQVSTPILAGVGIILVSMGQIVSAIIANLIGGLIFFWVDRFIFTSQALAAQWEVRENIVCSDCGKISRGYRLVRADNYDRSDHDKPEFRCEECSEKKTRQLRERGIRIE